MQQKFSVQDMVYNLDVGIGFRILRVSLYVLFVLVIMLFYTATQFRGLDNREAMDQAQIARNMAMGRGYVTRNMAPATIGYLYYTHGSHDPRLANHPELTRPPAYPFVLSLGFRAIRGTVTKLPGERGVYAPEQYIVLPVNHVFTLLTGLLVFLFGMRLFTRLQAVLATTVYFLSNSVWALSISGTGMTMVVFLVMAALYTLLRASDVRAAGGSSVKVLLLFLVGAGCAVAAALTRYAALVLVLPMGALLIRARFGKRGWLWAMAFALLCLVGVAPWLARNVMVSGRLFGIAPYMMLNDGNDTLLRGLGATFQLSDLFTRASGARWLGGVSQMYQREIWSLGGGLLGAFFVSSFFYRFVRDEVRQLRWVIALGVLLVIGLAGFSGESATDLLHLFTPLAILYGLAFFFLLFDRLQLEFRILELALITCVMVLSALPLTFALLPPRTQIPYPPYYPGFAANVSELFGADELLCTDMPWATAWYGDQPSVLLPQDVDEFLELNDYIHRVSGIYFTTLTRDKPYIRTLVMGPYRTWFPVLNGQLPQDFPLTEGRHINEYDQFILTDYPRWEARMAR